MRQKVLYEKLQKFKDQGLSTSTIAKMFSQEELLLIHKETKRRNEVLSEIDDVTEAQINEWVIQNPIKAMQCELLAKQVIYKARGK